MVTGKKDPVFIMLAVLILQAQYCGIKPYDTKEDMTDFLFDILDEIFED